MGGGGQLRAGWKQPKENNDGVHTNIIPDSDKNDSLELPLCFLWADPLLDTLKKIPSPVIYQYWH